MITALSCIVVFLVCVSAFLAILCRSLYLELIKAKRDAAYSKILYIAGIVSAGAAWLGLYR